MKTTEQPNEDPRDQSNLKSTGMIASGARHDGVSYEHDSIRTKCIANNTTMRFEGSCQGRVGCSSPSSPTFVTSTPIMTNCLRLALERKLAVTIRECLERFKKSSCAQEPDNSAQRRRQLCISLALDQSFSLMILWVAMDAYLAAPRS
jgi:hypothetical protein